MATSSSELNLVKKPNTTRSVWNYFGVTADETGVPVHAKLDKPICRLCKKTVPAKRSNATNLFTHLEDHHPSVFSEIVPTASRVPKRRQATLVEVVETAKKYDPKSTRAQELSRAVTHYIAKDMQLFCCVERSGFKHLVNVLDLKYQIPHFSKYEIPRLYNEVKGIVKPEVQRARYFAASTDLWCSKANHPYLSFTVCFISKKLGFELLLSQYCSYL